VDPNREGLMHRPPGVAEPAIPDIAGREDRSHNRPGALALEPGRCPSLRVRAWLARCSLSRHDGSGTRKPGTPANTTVLVHIIGSDLD
jgi:hypothetical protein